MLHREAAVAAGAINTLVHLLTSNNDARQWMALQALLWLFESDIDFLGPSGAAVPFLMQLLSDGAANHHWHSGWPLYEEAVRGQTETWAQRYELKSAIVDAGALHSLVDLVDRGHPECQGRAALLLGCIACNSHGHAQAEAVQQGLPPLVRLFNRSCAKWQEVVVMVIGVLAESSARASDCDR